VVGGPGIAAELERAGYRIDALIGEGGMGAVYRAEQLPLERYVALKVMSRDLAGDPLFRQRFLRESRIAASLEHPAVVPIFDAGQAEQILYLAMRLIPGTDLRALIRRERRLELADALEVTRQVAGALDAAHAIDLVHRDVKPSNVLIAEPRMDGALQSYLTDFGLSKRVVESTGGTMGRPLGSVHYMSPEHIRGETVDARSDVYSLGCLVYECLTGEVPFVRDSDVAVLYAHLEAPCPSASARRTEVPAAVDEVIAWALAKDPAVRPQSARELADGLERALAGSFERPAAAAHAWRDQQDGARGADAGAAAAGGGARARRTSGGALVGRLEQETALRRALEDALAGRGGLVLLVGEPGIGKTALARALADEATRRGVPAVWSTGGAFGEVPPYWHWIQVVQGLARRDDAEAMFASLGASAAWLAAIAPELAELAHVPPPASAAHGTEGRFHVYDALARLLERAAEGTGLVVVLDDLHLADEASALALGFIAELVRSSGVLLVGTYREGEPARADGEDSTAGASALAELRRFGHTIAVTGLRVEDVGDLIARRTDAPRSGDLARRLHEVTAGNPLFVSELLALLESEHKLDDPTLGSRTLPLPTGITDAIARRVAPLSGAGREALEVASVVGASFRAGIVAAASGKPPGEVLELLDQASQLGLVRPVADFGDSYAFSHGLVRATLYEALPRGRRCALHESVGEALEQSYDVAAGEGLASVAFHFLEAAPAGNAERAVSYARRAAERALATFAYDEAASLYTRALEIVDPKRGGERLSLLQALGEAQMRIGDTEAARRTLQRAADAARAQGDAQALARASLASGIWGLSMGIDEPLVRLAEDAVAQLEGTDARGLLASVKGQLAAALYWSDEVQRRERLAEEALSLARAEHEQLNTPSSARMLAYVIGRYLLTRWGPDSGALDYALSDEMIELSRHARDAELELLVRNWRVCVMCELGSFAAVDLEIARIEQMALELRQPRAMLFLPLHQATRATVVGRFAEAERLNVQTVDLGRRVRGSTGEIASTAQILSIRTLQGRLAELEDAVRFSATANPGMVTLQAVLALLLAQSGRDSEAHSELARLTRAGVAGLPRDNLHVLMMAMLGETAALLSDVGRASEILTWMRPYAGRWVSSPNAAILWPVERSLARLSILAGEYAEGHAHIEAARELARAAGARPSIALLALDEARLLAAQGKPEDAERVRALAGVARTLAQEFELGHVVDEATLLEAG
jgi:tetratricopeptide (TPR) repeat protein